MKLDISETYLMTYKLSRRLPLFPFSQFFPWLFPPGFLGVTVADELGRFVVVDLVVVAVDVVVVAVDAVDAVDLVVDLVVCCPLSCSSLPVYTAEKKELFWRVIYIIYRPMPITRRGHAIESFKVKGLLT